MNTTGTARESAQERGTASVAGLMFTLQTIGDAHLSVPAGIEHVQRARRRRDPRQMCLMSGQSLTTGRMDRHFLSAFFLVGAVLCSSFSSRNRGAQQYAPGLTMASNNSQMPSRAKLL